MLAAEHVGHGAEVVHRNPKQPVVLVDVVTRKREAKRVVDISARHPRTRTQVLAPGPTQLNQGAEDELNAKRSGVEFLFASRRRQAYM